MKMLRRTASLWLIALFLTGLAHADTLKKVTGADWLLMSPQEKKTYLHEALDFLQRRGVPLGRSAAYYGSALNEITDKPGSDKSEIINLLTTFVYKNEPYTRKAIDKFKKKPAAEKPAAAKH